MSVLKLNLKSNQTAFEPNSSVEGALEWSLERDEKWLEVRLIWFTQGKGTSDVSVVDASRRELPGRSGELPFRFALPLAPHSFSGQLISLVWAIEAITASKQVARLEFVMAPDGREIELERVEVPKSGLEEVFAQRKAAYQARKTGTSEAFDSKNDGGFTIHK